MTTPKINMLCNLAAGLAAVLVLLSLVDGDRWLVYLIPATVLVVFGLWGQVVVDRRKKLAAREW